MGLKKLKKKELKVQAKIHELIKYHQGNSNECWDQVHKLNRIQAKIYNLTKLRYEKKQIKKIALLLMIK